MSVTAVSGPSGNVEPNTITVIPAAEDPTTLSVRNKAATSGRARDEFPQVSGGGHRRPRTAPTPSSPTPSPRLSPTRPGTPGERHPLSRPRSSGRRRRRSTRRRSSARRSRRSTSGSGPPARSSPSTPGRSGASPSRGSGERRGGLPPGRRFDQDRRRRAPSATAGHVSRSARRRRGSGSSTRRSCLSS